MKKAEKIFLSLAIISMISCCAWCIVRCVKGVQFSINCTQHIKRAADASTVEHAKEELEKAISYAEKNGLTEGVVSVFLHQPKNDVGYWYQNMKEAYDELENLPEDATSLEKSNVLMNLRESLTDEGESSAHVIIPEGISIYPRNVEYFWWIILSVVSCVLFIYAWIESW